MTRAVLVVAAALCISACGGSDPAGTAEGARPDDAFVVRLARHQETGLSLARSAAAGARDVSVRKLARRMVRVRERTMPALTERLARVPSHRHLPDLAVAAETIPPDALEGARPLEPAFVTLMIRHDQSTLALTRAELERGTDAAVKALAQRIAADAARELQRLNRALVRLAKS